jgi:hypothetical protein
MKKTLEFLVRFDGFTANPRTFEGILEEKRGNFVKKALCSNF